jgi:hypothetical protein
MRVIVVLVGEREEREGSLCVMAVLGPFTGPEDARPVMAEVKAGGYVPHWMTVRPPAGWLGEKPG